MAEEKELMGIDVFRQDVIKAREELEISQKELAEDSGCSIWSVRALEEGQTKRVNRKTLHRLSDALGLDPMQYLGATIPSGEKAPVKPIKSTKRDPSSLEVKLLRLKDENAELKQQAELKGLYLQERINEVNALKEKLKEDEQIIDSLLIYVQRLKAGEIVG